MTTTAILNPTQKDRTAFEFIKDRIAELRRSVERRGHESSEWQYESCVVGGAAKITFHRIKRLVALGFLESVYDGSGNGYSVRVNPSYRRYL